MPFPAVARSATDRTRSPNGSRVVSLALPNALSPTDIRPGSVTHPRTAPHRAAPRRAAPRTTTTTSERASERASFANLSDGLFVAPSEHSLRGRNTQDCRVRIERIRDRNSRSGLLSQTDDRACRTRTGRASLGRAPSTAPMRENRRRRRSDDDDSRESASCRRRLPTPRLTYVRLTTASGSIVASCSRTLHTATFCVPPPPPPPPPPQKPIGPFVRQS